MKAAETVRLAKNCGNLIIASFKSSMEDRALYYTPAILYFGAEFTQVYSECYGGKIKPASYAVHLIQTEDEETVEFCLPRNTRWNRIKYSALKYAGEDIKSAKSSLRNK